MSDKSDLYQTLKGAGVKFDRPYVEYTTADLQGMLEETFPQVKVPSPGKDEALDILDELAETLTTPEKPKKFVVSTPRETPASQRIRQATQATPPPSPAQVRHVQQDALHQLSALVIQVLRAGQLQEGRSFDWLGGLKVPVKNKGAERAGLDHALPEGQPLRIDLSGRIWFRDEVAKPAVPKARMTRKSRYIDPGVKQVESYLPDGHLDEIYEVAGDSHKELTITTTLPSWQVGKYHDPRFPFSVHVYNGETGFDFQEIVAYYGGRDLVPGTIKTLYVGNQLCYQISSARETIESQFHSLQKGN